jgi:hypothetical protein
LLSQRRNPKPCKPCRRSTMVDPRLGWFAIAAELEGG